MGPHHAVQPHIERESASAELSHHVVDARGQRTDIVRLDRREHRDPQFKVDRADRVYHLAAAVGTRCVAMFGPTTISQCGPYGESHIALQEVYTEQSRRERRRAP